VADPTTPSQKASVNPDGSTNDALVDGKRPTYAAGIQGLAVAASATDIFTVTGSATKTIRIIRMRISGIKTGAGAAIDIMLLKRSTADTLGTSTAPNAIPYDSADAAATAVITAYTANPTVGTLVNTGGVVLVDSLFVPLATASGGQLNWEFGNRPARALVLRGVAQQLCLNLNGVTVAGGAFDIAVEWTEDNS
jgi:hypothetical protein